MIVLLIVLVVLGLMALGIFGFVVLLNAERAQKKAQENAPATLDAVFDGSPTVTVPVNMKTLKSEVVVAGAMERGYKLIHQSSNQYGPTSLVFEKPAN